MIETNSNSAALCLGRIETKHGEWTDYGTDGRTTTENVTGWIAGTGFRAKFSDNPHGGDYDWGPLAQSESDAITLFLAEQVWTLQEMLDD